MKITGSIKAEGAIQIDGKVDGDIAATDLVVGSTGEILGEVKAETLRVKGQAKGSIRAKKVELETGASVIGDIIHGALIIQPDASFEGQVKREENPLSVQKPKPAVAAATKPPAGANQAPSTESSLSADNSFPASTSGNA